MTMEKLQFGKTTREIMRGIKSAYVFERGNASRPIYWMETNVHGDWMYKYRHCYMWVEVGTLKDCRDAIRRDYAMRTR